VGARSLAFAFALACVACASAQADPLDPTEVWRERQAEWEAARFWIALLATILLGAGAALRATGREQVLGRSRNAALLILVLATVTAWWHPYRGSLRTWLHTGDSFHYYVGAKYFDELGYGRLYDCVLLADADAGQPGLRETYIRNLSTNRIESAARVLDRPALCKRHFSPARWQEFSEDVAWFRRRSDRYSWRRMRSDHGYNPPPTWTMVGAPLANALPVGRTSFFILTALDPLLLGALFASLAWGFGWQIACVALLFWGTNQPAAWEWYGGSILRMDWLAASGAGLACVRRGKPVAAGALLAWATCVRIFPIAIVGGIALGALWRMLRERTRPSEFQSVFGFAFAGCVAILVGASSLAVGSGSWVAFVENSSLHLETETVNRMGLHPMLGYRQASSLAENLESTAQDPYARWREQRALANRARRPLYLALAAAFCLGIGFAIRGQPSWVAGVLGVGLIPVLLELGSYYYGVLLLFAALQLRHPGAGAALMALAAATWCLGEWGDQPDRLVARMGGAILVFVALATGLVVATRGSNPSPRPSEPDAPA
jgi:hypothetical protein